jgi:hypothetical protein
MLVFYFTSAAYGLSNLENKHLKVSDFSNLNDPFELLGIEMSDKDVRTALRFEKSLIAKTKGLLCFSENKYDPVQWAHYGDNHQGVCLGFEIPGKRLKKVRYVSSRLAKSTLEESDKQEKILTTKFKHWEYEQERRMVLSLNNRKRINGLIFETFSPEMILKEIYIGCRSSLTFSDIQNKFESGEEKVIVKYTRPAFKDFRIVWDRKRKSAHA